MRRSTLGMWLLLGVAAGGFFVAAAGQAQTSPVPESIAKERIAKGRIVYTRYCWSCHGRDARGDGPLAPKNPRPADLTDAKWDHGSSDGEIYTLILNGAPAPMSEMKGMKGTLTPTQIWQVVNYIRSIGPKAPASAAKK